MIKLIIADDNIIVRKGLVNLLDNEPDISVIARAENGKQVLEANEPFVVC